MIEDLNLRPDGALLDCEVCVVGSGAVGIAIASELASRSVDVLVLESGGESYEHETQALYASSILGLPFPGAMEGRFRTLGGSTTRWAGQALTMDPLDFEVRPWVSHSGWPIRHAAVEPYYARAARYLGVDEWNFTTDLFARLRLAPPPLDDRDLSYHFSKWAPEPDLRKRFLPNLRRASQPRMLTHANLTRIDLAASLDHVERLTVRSLQGRRASIRARHVVICTGGIETARLLLLNDHQVPGGLGNRYDLVGRYFQDHPSAVVGHIETASPKRIHHWFNLFYYRGRKYAVRLSATEEFQRRQATLNLSSGVRFDLPAGSPVHELKALYPRLRRGEIDAGVLRSVLTCVRGAPSLIAPLYAYAVRRRQYTPGAVLTVGVTSEQEPDPDSRVFLATERDALGLRRSAIHWSLSELTGRSIRLFAATLRDQMARAELGTLVLAPWVLGSDGEWRGQVADVYHHMGTARMSDSPSRGVVDPTLRVHGIDNLYLAGTAVFPTGGHSNPTFTAIALGFRLADRLAG